MRVATGCLGIVVAALAGLPALAQRQFEEGPIKRYSAFAPFPTRALALGDLDGDGDLDLVITDPVQHRVFANGGNGSLTDVTAFTMPALGSAARAVVPGDVDGDGDLDLVLGNRGARNQLLLNSGAGIFGNATSGRLPPTSTNTEGIVLVDCDGDLDLDLVAVNNGQQDRLYLNDGTGVFSDATAGRMPTDAGRSTSVVAADVDGDGDPDLVIGDRTQVRLYQNDGTGAFADVTASHVPSSRRPTEGVALADVDGDGDLDLALANVGQNQLYLNDGTGAFTDATAARLPVDNASTSSVLAVDVDGDGDVDLAFGNYDFFGQNTLFVNDGTGSFVNATAASLPAGLDGTRALAAGDVDGDGDLDLVAGNTSPANRLYLNDGAGVFADPGRFRLPADADATTSVAAADVDGDGDLDLVIGNYSEAKKLYLNNGSGVFSDVTTAQMPPSGPTYDATLQVAAGDVDGDSDVDIVVANSGLYYGLFAQNELYLNDGAGTFVDATGTHLPVAAEYTTSVALGDVDGDGDVDIVFGNYLTYGSGALNSLYLNDGTGRFVDATAGRLPAVRGDTGDVVLGDVDGDGDLDLVCANGFSQRQNHLFRNNGAGFFDDVTAGRMPVDNDDSRALALADVDGDSDLDMVIGNAGVDRLYLNDGTGRFTRADAGRFPAASVLTRDVSLDDLDGDADADIVVAGTGGSRLYVNDGTGTFVEATAARLPPTSGVSSSVTLVDQDGDGDPDLVLGYNGAPNVAYLNLHRQLSAPVNASLSKRYDLELRSEPGYGQTVHTGAVVLGAGLVRLPLSLPPLGRFYLTPSPLLAIPPVTIRRESGQGVVSLSIPGSSSLVGITLYFQALIVSPAGAHLTGWVADEIGR